MTSALFVGCSVASDTKSTGGVRLPDASPGAGGANASGDARIGAPADGAQADGPDGASGEPQHVCDRALAILGSDYTSTNVSVASPLGKILSESIISSGSAPPGITTALSGDVYLPSTRPRSGRLVLIDSYPNSVVTWLDVQTGGVLRQLSVATGFPSNPHDYLEVSDTKAYVTRYETNPNPGKQKYDSGGDVLVLDTRAFSITGHIPLAQPNDGALLPRADRMVPVGDEAWVMLERIDVDFKLTGNARLVGIDTTTDMVTWSRDLNGAEDCGGMALSPSGKFLAVSCSGGFNGAGSPALVLLDATVHPPAEIKRFPTTGPLNAPLAPGLAFATESLLFGVADGDKASRNDILFTVNVDTGEVRTVLDAGASFVLGDVRCAPGCTDLCFVADAGANAVRKYRASGATGVVDLGSFPVDPSIGLPPRSLGGL